MISSQLHQELASLDEIVSEADTDFPLSGLKTTSLIRVTRLAVVSGDVLLGSIGEVDPTRLRRIKESFCTLDRGNVVVFCGCSPGQFVARPRVPEKCARRLRGPFHGRKPHFKTEKLPICTAISLIGRDSTVVRPVRPRTD